MEVKLLTCKNCGEPLNLSTAKNGVLKCKYCSTEHVLPNDDTPEEAKLYLHDGQRALDVGNFDEALICFDKVLEIEPIEPEGYFGKFLAKHKVQYLKDLVNNRLQPIVHELIDKDILEDNDFKKAYRFANSDQKEIYQKRVEEIDHIKKSFMELEKSNLDYDCFICVKVTDDETKGRTKDSRTAEKIYDVLKRKGYKPFYSEIEIKGRTGSDYEAMILYALMKSECMLVVCSNEEYLNTKWVKNEYTRFLKLVNDEVKASDAITIVFDGKPIEKLPGKKGKVQGINLEELDAIETIEKYVYNHTPKAKKEREANEKAKLEKEDELKKRLEEQAEIIRKLQEQQSNAKQSSSVDLSSINILELIEKAQKEKKAKERANKEHDDNEYDGVFIFNDNKNTLVEYIGESDEVEIPDFVTIIGEKAFLGCNHVTSVTIPNSVKRIDSYAFSDCSFLTTINIPSSVTNIGNYAFSGCKSLTSITIPNSVKKIGDNVFEFCESLTSIDIPSSITSIGARTFEKCTSLTSIKIPDSVTSIGDHIFYRCTALKSIVLSNKLRIIGDSAFAKCSGLSTIIIPSSVTSIGDFAFQNCNLLTSITIPSNVTRIGDSAFSNCSSLTINCEANSKPSEWNQYWNYSNRPVNWSCKLPLDKNQIENEAKINKQKKKEEDDFVFDTNDKNRIIKYVGKSKNLVIPNFVTSIGIGAFSECDFLTSIEIPSGVTRIESNTFDGCKLLNSIEIPSGVISIGDFAFSNCRSLISIKIPDSVTSIGNCSFWNCYSLKSIVIPNNVTSIGSSAFYGCENLSSIVLSNNIKKISESMFSKCKSLESINIPNSVTTLGAHAFKDCNSLKSINISNFIESIGEDAFQNCNSLTIYCNESDIPKGWHEKWNSSSRPVNWSYGNSDEILNNKKEAKEKEEQEKRNAALKDGFVFDANDKNKLIKYEGNSTVVEIPDFVISIGEKAFYMRKSIKSLSIPNSVKSIGGEAFAFCESLTSVIIPNSVTFIGQRAFYNCKSLIIYCEASNKPSEWSIYWSDLAHVYWGISENNFLIQDGLIYLVLDGNAVVTGYTNEQSNNVVIPSVVTINGTNYSIKSINTMAFNKNLSLASITIPNGVENIKNHAFWDCKLLKSIKLPNSLTHIESHAFFNCQSLTSIIIPNGVTSIGNFAFYSCSSLTSIAIPSSVTSIGEEAFSWCKSLKSIVIPSSVTYMSYFVFLNCTKLESIKCEAKKKISSWNKDWSCKTNKGGFLSPRYKVIWGYKKNILKRD